MFPIIQTALFFAAIGKDPRDIKMAIVNEEAGNCDYGRNIGSVIYNPDLETCDYVNISCRFLQGFNDKLMDKVRSCLYCLILKLYYVDVRCNIQKK